MKRLCYAVDLKNDDLLIKEYERLHEPGNTWPEINQSILNAGITRMEIYRTGNRLFMLIDTTDDFDPKKKKVMDAANPHVQLWEQFMWKFQQPLPWAAEGEKWVEMTPLFILPEPNL